MIAVRLQQSNVSNKQDALQEGVASASLDCAFCVEARDRDWVGGKGHPYCIASVFVPSRFLLCLTAFQGPWVRQLSVI